jgi:hypothetical protein
VKAHRSRQEAPADRSGAKAHQRATSGARQRPSLYAGTPAPLVRQRGLVPTLALYAELDEDAGLELRVREQ